MLHCRPANTPAAGKMLVSHRTATSNAAAARSTSSRVRPFSAAVTRSSKAQQKQQNRLVAKAAEEEQPEPEIEEEVPEQAIAAEEFQFNLSEAKKVRWFLHIGRGAAAAYLGQCCPTAWQQHMAATGSGHLWGCFSKQCVTLIHA